MNIRNFTRSCYMFEHIDVITRFKTRDQKVFLLLLFATNNEGIKAKIKFISNTSNTHKANFIHHCTRSFSQIKRRHFDVFESTWERRSNFIIIQMVIIIWIVVVNCEFECVLWIHVYSFHISKCPTCLMCTSTSYIL